MNNNLSQTRGFKAAIKALIITSSIYLLVIVYSLSTATKGSANSTDISNARTKYPKFVNTRIDSCSLCHTSAPSLNPYGQDYKDNGNPRSIANLVAIESKDSDGDGFTNIQEIMALTFPGASSDFPKPNTSTPTAIVQPTATSTRIPGPTATSVATATPGPSPMPGIGPTATPRCDKEGTAGSVCIQPTGTPRCGENGRDCNEHHKHHRHRKHKHS